MKLSLIIPVYNEARHLEAFLDRVDALSFSVPHELVIVDDGSSDDSGAILRDHAFRSAVTLARLAENRGKGAAVRRGIDLASGTIIGIKDADFEYDGDEIQRLLAPLLAGEADVVYGSRFHAFNTLKQKNYCRLSYAGNRLLTRLSNLLSGGALSDMETGSKFFRADLLKNIVLESNRFGFEPEITAKLARLTVRLHELPISYAPRSAAEGKKISWRDGVAALFHLVRFNLLQARTDFVGPELPARFR